MLRQSKTTFKPGCNKRTSERTAVATFRENKFLLQNSSFWRDHELGEVVLAWHAIQCGAVGIYQTLDGQNIHLQNINTYVVYGFYCLYLRGAMNPRFKSSDGPNPSQSDIFPEKYTQCRQQFYLHSRPRKPWEKTLQVWPTLHLFFLPNHHKWTNATSLCKQDILSLNHSTSINYWWNSLYYSRFNHSTYRGNLKWQINSEIRTFK